MHCGPKPLAPVCEGVVGRAQTFQHRSAVSRLGSDLRSTRL